MSNQIVDGRTIVSTADVIGSWSDEAHGTMSAAINNDVFVEGDASVGDKIAGAGASGGIGWDYGSNTDLSSSIVYMWGNSSTATALESKAAGGIAMRFTGATDTDFFEVNLDGSDTYGGGWKMFVVDVAKAKISPDTIGGSPPPTTAIHWVGLVFRTTTAIGGGDDNMFCDVFATLAVGTPGIRIEGDNAGEPWTWDDVVAAGDVADPTKAWGTVRAISGVVFLNTPVRFGEDDGTDADAFEDSGKIIVWEDQFVRDNFYGFDGAANTAQTATCIFGSKIGTGATATGVNGGSITTGGPRWYMSFEDADTDEFGLYGVSMAGLGTAAINHAQLEMLNCVLVNCDTITLSGAASLALSPVVRNCFFSEAPGPAAQILWSNSTSPYAAAFDLNTFANMVWFAIEIRNAISPFNMRDNVFTNNGALRDVLTSHDTGAIDITSTAAALPQGTNGSTIFITTAVGSTSCDLVAWTVATFDEVQTASGTDQANTGTTLATLTTGSLTAYDDSFSVALARVPALDPITYSGASDQYTDGITVGGPGQEDIEVAIGYPDEVTPGAGTRTSFPVYSGTELNAVNVIIPVIADTTTAVGLVDPAFRPWQYQSEVDISDSFGYGAGVEASNPKRKTFVIAVTYDQNDTQGDIDAVDLDTGAGTQVFTLRESQTNTVSKAIRITVWELPNATETLDQGTVTIKNTVTLEVTGLNEGASVTMEATGGGDLVDGDQVGSFPKIADNTGVAQDTAFEYTNPQDVIIRARYSGAPVGIVIDDISDGAYPKDYTVRANSSGARMVAGTSIVLNVAKTFTRTVGSWLNDGFTDAMEIDLQGSASNDGNFTVNGTPSATVLTVTEAVVTEAAQTDLTITGDYVLCSVSPTELLDVLYFGGYTKFTKIKITVTQPFDGSVIAGAWEYYNGSVWSTLSGVDDVSLANFTALGEHTVQLQDPMPSNWAKISSADTMNIDAYWVRRFQVITSGTSVDGHASKIALNTTRYLPFKTTGTITADGLSIQAVWIEDTIID